MNLPSRWRQAIERSWWQRQGSALSNWLGALLAPAAALYGLLSTRQRRRDAASATPLPVPVIVVGNWVVGGAGKTPVTLALLKLLRGWGYTPGVVSRGYASAQARGAAPSPVHAHSSPARIGDEPLLIAQCSGVPVWVAGDRVAAAKALLGAHPEVNILVADDALQHTRLARCVQVVVADERGAGNGRLLPAGPLREPIPSRLPPRTLLLYNAASPSLALPGQVLARTLGHAWPLAEWLARRGQGEALGGASEADSVPLATLAARSHTEPMLATAGIAAPERFFAMLEAAGIRLAERLALPDHHAWASLPWPGSTHHVLITEKDAVKLKPHTQALAAPGAPRVWVIPLDLAWPAAAAAQLKAWLDASAKAA